MNTAKYQKAQYIREMLAEESAGHGLNMQVILAGLPETELQVLEKVANRCRSARATHKDPETVTFVLDWEQEFA